MIGIEDIAGDVELLVYPACAEAAGSEGWLEADENDAERDKTAPTFPAEDFEKRIEDERIRAFEAGRERGQLEGRQAEREAEAPAQKAAQAQATRQAAELVARFAEERDRYMRSVELEVVKLALAIAARILCREAQMDPLLLTGAVRVALGQIAGATEVTLLVPATELDLWSDAMTHLPNLPIRPKVRAGDGMRLGECLVETVLGSVDLGIRSQLAEIERGFFDRERNPRKSADRSPAVQCGAERDA